VRYISGEVEIEELNYSERFTNYLNKKIGPIDNYIEKLEKLCSIIFVISFLLIFYVIAIFVILHLINFLGSFNTHNTSIIFRILIISTQILLQIGAVLTFFDYITQGLLKRNKWISLLYFPFYWIFSFLTLFFYTGLYIIIL